jgi:hypothetical protein
MNKTFFFLLTERDDTRIAVVAASTNEELNQKATMAINDHFDIETETVLNLNMDDYICGDTEEFDVIVDKNSEDAESYKSNIFIETVDLY